MTDLYDPRTQWPLYIINAKAGLQLKDVNYIVKGEVVIVDEFTGRTMVGRRWSTSTWLSKPRRVSRFRTGRDHRVRHLRASSPFYELGHDRHRRDGADRV